MNMRDSHPPLLTDLDRELNNAIRALVRIGLALGVLAAALWHFT